MSSNLSAVRDAVLSRWSQLLVRLLGEPQQKNQHEWRWNRRGSLVATLTGPKAGSWIDHETSLGGGPFELIARMERLDRRGAIDWARTWVGADISLPIYQSGPPATHAAASYDEAERRHRAQHKAAEIWRLAAPADPSHPYLVRKDIPPCELRQDSNGSLIVPLVDVEGVLHTIQFIRPDGTKSFLPGGGKSRHFALIGGPLAGAARILICEGWATGATAHLATGLPVVVAMDAGNLRHVAALLREKFPGAILVILADNDAGSGRDTNPGVIAATAAAHLDVGLLATPPQPGDMNDLAASAGLPAVAACIAAAACVTLSGPTYPMPTLEPMAARDVLSQRLGRFFADVEAYWSPASPSGAVSQSAPATDATRTPRLKPQRGPRR